MRRKPSLTSLDAGLITPPLILLSLHPGQGINWRMACHQKTDASHSAFPPVVRLAMRDTPLSSSSNLYHSTILFPPPWYGTGTSWKIRVSEVGNFRIFAFTLRTFRTVRGVEQLYHVTAFQSESMNEGCCVG